MFLSFGRRLGFCDFGHVDGKDGLGAGRLFKALPDPAPRHRARGKELAPEPLHFHLPGFRGTHLPLTATEAVRRCVICGRLRSTAQGDARRASSRAAAGMEHDRAAGRAETRAGVGILLESDSCRLFDASLSKSGERAAAGLADAGRLVKDR